MERKISGRQKSASEQLEFEMTIRLTERDVQQTGGDLSLQFEGEVSSRDVNLEFASIEVIFKIVKMEENINTVSTDRKEKGTKL